MTTHNSPERKLDPFAFPPETNGRFTTLIVAAITLMWLISLNFFRITYFAFGITYSPEVDLPQMLQVTEEALGNRENLSELTDTELTQFAQKMRPILVNSFIQTSLWISPILILIMLMVSGAVLIYRTHPARIRWRNNLRLLPQSEDHEIDKVMQELSEQAGVSPVPTIWTSKRGRVNGQAFGRRHNYMLRVSAAKLLLRKYPDKFRTLVAHELGHIANGDVWRAYFSQAIWTAAFLIVVFMIAMLILLAIPNLQQIRPARGVATLLGQLLAQFIVVTAIWRGLLRSREFYADWRVTSWGMEKTLASILSAQVKEEKKERTLWQRIQTLHPSSTERLNMLKHPIKLFRIAPDLPFLTGLILAITIFGLPSLVNSLFLPILSFFEIVNTTLVPIVLALPFPLGRLLYFVLILFLRLIPAGIAIIGTLLYIGYLITSTLGVQVQRETIADLAHGVHRFRSYARLWLPAILLTIGLQLGFLIIPVGYSPPTSQWVIWLSLIWLIGFSFLTWLWLAYIRALTQLTMGSHVGYRNPKRAKLFVNTFSSVSLAVFYPPVFLLLITIQFVERQLPISMLPVSNSSLSPSVFIGITIIVLLLIALSYFFGAMLSLLSLYGWLRLRPAPNCPECGDPTPHQIVVGQRCGSCSSPLSPWIYVDKNKIAPSS